MSLEDERKAGHNFGMMAACQLHEERLRQEAEAAAELARQVAQAVAMPPATRDEFEDADDTLPAFSALAGVTEHKGKGKAKSKGKQVALQSATQVTVAGTSRKPMLTPWSPSLPDMHELLAQLLDEIAVHAEADDERFQMIEQQIDRMQTNLAQVNASLTALPKMLQGMIMAAIAVVLPTQATVAEAGAAKPAEPAVETPIYSPSDCHFMDATLRLKPRDQAHTISVAEQGAPKAGTAAALAAGLHQAMTAGAQSGQSPTTTQAPPPRAHGIEEEREVHQVHAWCKLATGSILEPERDHRSHVANLPNNLPTLEVNRETDAPDVCTYTDTLKMHLWGAGLVPDHEGYRALLSTMPAHYARMLIAECQ
ncbi:hypothetical protein GGH91_003532 [Coemansia sp. RSA 2671]|nr:hypothetical protein LPJ60_006066 [Coemansia sp. RSA 2675]KAJ2342408.1 hypothetical protein GGH91_003532 [Coemansia sp. RSA 2671]